MKQQREAAITNSHQAAKAREKQVCIPKYDKGLKGIKIGT